MLCFLRFEIGALCAFVRFVCVFVYVCCATAPEARLGSSPFYGWLANGTILFDCREYYKAGSSFRHWEFEEAQCVWRKLSETNDRRIHIVHVTTDESIHARPIWVIGNYVRTRGWPECQMLGRALSPLIPYGSVHSFAVSPPLRCFPLNARLTTTTNDDKRKSRRNDYNVHVNWLSIEIMRQRDSKLCPFWGSYMAREAVNAESICQAKGDFAPKDRLKNNLIASFMRKCSRSMTFHCH